MKSIAYKVFPALFMASVAVIASPGTPEPVTTGSKGAFDGFYVGGGLGSLSASTHVARTAAGIRDFTKFTDQTMIAGLFMGYGSSVFENFYVGGEVNASISNYNAHYHSRANTTIKHRIRDSFGVFGRVGVKVRDFVLVYVKGGLSWTGMEARNNEFAGDGKKNKRVLGRGLGIGIDFAVTQNCILGMEYTHTWHKSINFNNRRVNWNIKPQTNTLMLRAAWKI